MTETGADWLTATTPGYATKVTVVNTAAFTAWTQVLAADPRRWWVQFQGASGGVTLAWVLPGESQPAAPLNQTMPGPYTVKYQDAPSVTQGPWWTSGGLGNSLVIIECLYVGE